MMKTKVCKIAEVIFIYGLNPFSAGNVQLIYWHWCRNWGCSYNKQTLSALFLGSDLLLEFGFCLMNEYFWFTKFLCFRKPKM